MKLIQLEDLQRKLQGEWEVRKSLGGFDTNSSTILLCLETLFQLTTHLVDLARKEEKRKHAARN